MIGKISLADDFEQGRSRTIVDHFLYRLETIIAKTVLAGSFDWIDEPIILPPLYVYSDLTRTSSICTITFPLHRIKFQG